MSEESKLENARRQRVERSTDRQLCGLKKAVTLQKNSFRCERKLLITGWMFGLKWPWNILENIQYVYEVKIAVVLD